MKPLDRIDGMFLSGVIIGAPQLPHAEWLLIASWVICVLAAVIRIIRS